MKGKLWYPIISVIDFVLRRTSLKKGRYVKIVRCIHGHNFLVGETVYCWGVKHTATDALKNIPNLYLFNMLENKNGAKWTVGSIEVSESTRYDFYSCKSMTRIEERDHIRNKYKNNPYLS